MAANRRLELIGSVEPGSHGDARQQLWEAAIARDVVDVEFRTAVAVGRADAGEQLSALVDLERLPGIDHRRRTQVRRRLGARRVRCVDRDHTDVRAVRRRSGRVVVVALVAGLVLEPRLLPARAVAARLADQLQIATRALETGGA